MVPKADWEVVISTAVSDMLQNQTPRCVLDVRAKMVDLVVQCIPPETILLKMTEEILKRVDDRKLGLDVVKWAAHYVTSCSVIPSTQTDQLTN